VTFNDLNLNKPLLNALADLGLSEPTPIQEQVFPVIMSGRDLVGIAQTGTGKTFAYLLPILRQLNFSETKHPRVVIIVPTRELVLQVMEEVKKLTVYTSLRSVGIYGGTNINTQKQLIHDGLDILVATPGRLVDLISTGILRVKSVQKLVIDEVDQMLALGFRPQMISFMETLPPNRQNLMFSATFTDEVEVMINRFFKQPIWIEAGQQGVKSSNIDQSLYEVPNFYTKRNLLMHLLDTDESMSKVLVFVSTKALADKLEEELIDYYPGKIGVLHASKMQSQRIAALRGFELGNTRVLIANDIASRGLDVDDITHVINFDAPVSAEDYIHRIGRTGRAEKRGVAITFFKPEDEAVRTKIEKASEQPIAVIPFPDEVEESNVLIKEEIPVVFERETVKRPKDDPERGPAFHEKKAKNKKVNLGGARAQESRRRANAKRASKRKR